VTYTHVIHIIHRTYTHQLKYKLKRQQISIMEQILSQAQQMTELIASFCDRFKISEILEEEFIMDEYDLMETFEPLIDLDELVNDDLLDAILDLYQVENEQVLCDETYEFE
jgi:hypothetical protein